MRKFFLVTILILVLAFLSLELKNRIQPAAVVTEPSVSINSRIFTVEIAADLPAQIKGLSGRDWLEPDRGMLFVFPEKKVRNFWMKNMNFPIDIIWLEDFRIANISRNLPPEGESPGTTYSSIVPVNYVLEINAGLAEKYGFSIGDEVRFDL